MFRNLKLEPFTIREDAEPNKIKIAFIGVGQCGNKITTEFIKLDSEASLINTCQEDLDEAVTRIRGVMEEKYEVIKLEGFDGAAKDRHIGKQAVRANFKVLNEKLIADKRLIEADLVFVVIGLGGGTGTGAVEDVVKIVSGIMRKEKRYKIKYDNSGKVIDIGRPTVGVIAASPEGDSKHKIWLNCAETLNELEKLQEQRLLGNILMIDNEKLIEDFLKKDDRETEGTDWVTYGNETTASILTELKIVTSLPGKETVDKAEFLDICTKPGYLTLGKWRINRELINDIKHKVKNNEQGIYDYIVRTSFINQNIFADGYDFNYCMHGGLAILTHPESEIIGAKQTIMLKKAMNNVLDSPLVETPHFGIYDNNVFGTIENPKENIKDEAIIYTMAVIKKRPPRILKKTAWAIEEDRRKKELEMSTSNDELSELLKSVQSPSPTSGADQLAAVSLDLGDIFGTSLEANSNDSDNKKDEVSEDDPMAELRRLMENNG
ncbi:tubulin-like doman-containing protein [Wukongibacter baidiensis]